MIIEEVTSVQNVFSGLIIGMKNIFILIGCVKYIFQVTKAYAKGNTMHKMLINAKKAKKLCSLALHK